MKIKNFGFLRESQEIADKSGTSKLGIARTGLDTYLSVIFPHTKDWIYDKVISGSGRLFRPDYRSESLKLIVEFDGLPHYTNPVNVLLDKEKTMFYEKLGYKVVRIPFFIQLTNSVVKTLFGVNVKTKLFPEDVASMCVADSCTPAFMCVLGIKRMQQEFKKFPRQLRANIKQLEKEDKVLSGIKYLKTIK